MAGIEHYPVADGNGILDEDEQPGNHIVHQLLRAEADGQADHPGTGQERRDVGAQVGHGGDGVDDDQDHFDRIVQHRQDGPHQGARLTRAAAADGGLSASWMSVSSTTHSSQVTSRIKAMLDSELLIAWPRLLLRAKSTTEKPQMRPSSSMKVTAMSMRSSAWARLRSSSLQGRTRASLV